MLVMVHIDTAPGEVMPYIFEELIKLGAVNVHAIPCFTKKGRPGFIFLIETARENLEKIGAFLAGEYGNLGMRLFEPAEHIKIDHEMSKVRLIHPDKGLNVALNVKVIQDSKGHIASARVEYEELKEAVHTCNCDGEGITLTALKEIIEASVLSDHGCSFRGLKIELEKD
ncbi:Pyridinium-3,5-bisthiocarboxylic acid mononucleotide nickel insertion protein [subsurface metagenome]